MPLGLRIMQLRLGLINRLEHGPHSCKLPMFAEDVSRDAFAIFPME